MFNKAKYLMNLEQNDSERHLYKGIRHKKSRKLNDAFNGFTKLINDLNKVIEINNNKYNAFLYLFGKYQKNIVQNLEKAIAEFDKEINLDKKNIKSFFNKAIFNMSKLANKTNNVI
jgi:tetratricopeptide (TPR) repeat protein